MMMVVMGSILLVLKQPGGQEGAITSPFVNTHTHNCHSRNEPYEKAHTEHPFFIDYAGVGDDQLPAVDTRT